MAPANGTNCTSTTSSVVPYSDTVYIIQIIIFIITIFVIFANIALHFFVKELQTVSGALIVALCFHSDKQMLFIGVCWTD